MQPGLQLCVADDDRELLIFLASPPQPYCCLHALLAHSFEGASFCLGREGRYSSSVHGCGEDQWRLVTEQ